MAIKCIQFLFYSNLLLAVSSFSFIYAWNKDEFHGMLYALFVSLGVLLVYNFDSIRQFNLGINSEIKRNWFLKNILINKLIVLFTSICFLFLVILHPVFSLAIVSKFSFVIGFYFYYTFLNGRKIPMAKMWLIASSWAFVVAINFYFSDFLKLLILFLSLAIFSDCKDVNYDENQLKTIPQMVGIYSSKWVGILMYLCFIVLEFYRSNLNAMGFGFLSLIVVYIFLFHMKVIEKKSISLTDSTLIVLGIALLFN